jgi:hypothetical protein
LTKIFVLFGIDLGVRFYAIWHWWVNFGF